MSRTWKEIEGKVNHVRLLTRGSRGQAVRSEPRQEREKADQRRAHLVGAQAVAVLVGGAQQRVERGQRRARLGLWAGPGGWYAIIAVRREVQRSAACQRARATADRALASAHQTPKTNKTAAERSLAPSPSDSAGAACPPAAAASSCRPGRSAGSVVAVFRVRCVRFGWRVELRAGRAPLRPSIHRLVVCVCLCGRLH
jgi:hypothetical protein